MKQLRSIFGIIATLFIGGILSAATGVSPIVTVPGIAAMGYISGFFPKPASIALSAIDISGLAAYAGKYEKKLFSTLVNALDIADDITVITTLKNTLKLTKLTIANIAKPFSSTHQPTANALVYSGRDLAVKVGKADLLIEPMDYRDTWMSEVMRGGINPKEIPFAAYVWGEVVKKFASELNDTTAWSGVYNGAGAGAVDIATGLGTLIANEIVATNIVPVVTGAITNVNAVAAIETMMKAMPAAYRKMGFNLYVSYDIFDKYSEDYRERYKKYVSEDDDGKVYVDRTSRRVQIVPTTWQGTSQRIVATPKANLLMGTDLLGDINKINTVEDVWSLKAGLAMAIGFQIRDLGGLKVNDQA